MNTKPFAIIAALSMLFFFFGCSKANDKDNRIVQAPDEAGDNTADKQEVTQKNEEITLSNKKSFDRKPPVGTKAFCPVMQNEFAVTESTETSEFEGKTYAFCCSGCKPKFDADPAKYL